MVLIFIRLTLVVSVLLSCTVWASPLGHQRYVIHEQQDDAGLLVSANKRATLYVDKGDYKGVVRAFHDLNADFARVTGAAMPVAHEVSGLKGAAVIIGTIGKSELVDQLIAEKKINPSAITGKWDAYHLELVDKPIPGVEHAWVIAGADKRGTIYGIYDLSEQIGVSPWYYWADVPSKKSKSLYIAPRTQIQDFPRVKYRGIFLNDEAPALTSWVEANHGNYTHEFYVKVFELILRLKGNFLWPAMWNNAFSDDDPKNMILADEYGIVTSNSHHEPMMRADKEWNRYGKGKWDYSVNAENLYDFWMEGAKRHKNYESIFTLGMRGQEDTPMSEDENIGLLERIVDDQRKILEEVFDDRDISDVPQVWTLYKEVQSYYENGMRVPDDVTLLWSDDNWGNIRRLPTPQERKRKGGAGVYYHFDYVGGPRSYRWMNVTPLAKIWEQMNLAYHYDATQIWITNVGDLKPMEYPIEYFLRLAWNPEQWPKEKIQDFGLMWASREFGAEYAAEIEALMTGYTRHNGRRRPELMSPETYSVLYYDEAERIEAELADLVSRAERLYKKMPSNKKDAFFQLVLHPVKAAATVSRLNIAVAKNRLYAMQGRASANQYAKEAKAFFQTDAKLKQQYHELNGGKWDGFMNQTHIGYIYWNNPEGEQMPVLFDYSPGEYAEMGVAVEGFAAGWPAPVDSGWLEAEKEKYELAFDQMGKQQRWLDVYNRGTKPFDYQASVSADWITLDQTEGKVITEQRLNVGIKWDLLDEGETEGYVSIKGTSWQSAKVLVKAVKHSPKLELKGFVEADGYISIDAADFTHRKEVKGFSWQEVEQLGRTKSSLASLPISDDSFKKAKKAPYVEYDVTFTNVGEFEIKTLFAPSWPIDPTRGLRYAIAVGEERPKVVDFIAGMQGTDDGWEESVKDGVRVGRSIHKVKKPGPTTIRVYMIDTGVAFQKIIVDTGGLMPSYLGPQASVQK